MPLLTTSFTFLHYSKTRYVSVAVLLTAFCLHTPVPPGTRGSN